MFDGLKFKRLAREAAPAWADEAIELFGYNAEDVIAQQVELHRYPERYSFQFCLKEIRKRRKLSAPSSPSRAGRIGAALRRRITWSQAEPIET